MIRLPPRSTRTDTLFPYTTLFRSDLAFRQSCGVDRRGLLHDSIVDPAARGRLLPLDVPWPLCRGGGADDAAKGRSLRTTRARLWLCPIGRAIRLAAPRLSDRAADRSEERRVGKACVSKCSFR